MPAGNTNYITENIAKVRERLSRATKICDRELADITLLAVSKGQPASAIAQAHSCGLADFGENYLQEASVKICSLQHLPLRWHYIGAIQSNKTTALAQQFDWVHSVDRISIAERLSRARAGLAPLNICLQVNIDAEPSKAGFAPADVLPAAIHIATLADLRLRGLMAIPEASDLVENQRRSFANMRQLFGRLQARLAGIDTLSMGMSADMEAAIAEGATMLRIGTAIFGPRAIRTADRKSQESYHD